MPISEADLRDLLVERSTAQPLVADRLDSVHARIVRRRHRRLIAAIAGVAGVVAVLGVGAAVAVPLWTSHPGTPAVSGLPDEPPEFWAGGKLIASARLNLSQQTSVSAAFTPTNLQLTVRVSCAGGWQGATSARVDASINGRLEAIQLCSEAGGANSVSDPHEQDWQNQGVAVGKASTVTLSLHNKDTASSKDAVRSPQARPAGDAIVAVYERVPVDQYVFPPRPKTLQPLPTSGPGAIVLDSRTAGATGRWTLPVTVSELLEFSVDAVAPGALSFEVGGKSIGTCESWNYDDNGCAIGLDRGSLANYGFDVRDGQRLDVVVTASRFAEPAWLLREGRGAGA